MRAYTGSTGLGELSQDQTQSNQLAFSVLNTGAVANNGASGAAARDLTLGQIIRHPGLGMQLTTASNDAERVYSGTARGKYFVFSAGADGIFFSRRELGLATGAATDIVSSATNPDGPKVLDKFDDLVVAGGG